MKKLRLQLLNRRIGVEPRVAGGEELKIFKLKQADATASRKLIIGIFPKKILNLTTISVDIRTNSLVVRGPEDVLAVIEALLFTLDTQDARKPFVATPGANNKKDAAKEGQQTLASPTPEDWLKELESAVDPETEVARVDQEFRRQDQLAVELAQQYRETHSSSAPDRPGLLQIKAALENAVTAAFEARQKIQSYEVEKLRRRLAQVEQHIAIREPLQKQIIERRIEELLQPEKKWEPAEEASDPSPATSKPPRESAKLSVPKPAAASLPDSAMNPRKALLDAEAAIASAQSEVTAAQKARGFAQADFDRVKDFHRKGIRRRDGRPECRGARFLRRAPV